MTSINTNIGALVAQKNMLENTKTLDEAMARLSSGKRINSAADDAAGSAIASKMEAQVRSIGVAIRNANDAISLLQTADGAIGEMSSMLQRMRELAVQADNGTNSSTDLTALDTEFDALEAEIERIANNTQWNGTALLSGASAFSFQVGANASQAISVTIKDFNTANGDATAGVFENLDTASTYADETTAGQDLAGLDIASTSNHANAITYLTNAITRVDTQRATIGSAINQLEYAADNLANVSQNTSASRSRILDADYASETTELARTQIIQQAATAMLSQANQQAQSVLALLK
jgi:flagellin